MCFETEYDCHISCLNGDLDMSALANGTIKRVGEYGGTCHSTCSLVERSSDIGLTTEGYVVADPFPLVILFVGTMIVLVVVWFIFSRLNKSKDKP